MGARSRTGHSRSSATCPSVVSRPQPGRTSPSGPPILNGSAFQNCKLRVRPLKNRFARCPSRNMRGHNAFDHPLLLLPALQMCPLAVAGPRSGSAHRAICTARQPVAGHPRSDGPDRHGGLIGHRRARTMARPAPWRAGQGLCPASRRGLCGGRGSGRALGSCVARRSGRGPASGRSGRECRSVRGQRDHGPYRDCGAAHDPPPLVAGEPLAHGTALCRVGFPHLPFGKPAARAVAAMAGSGRRKHRRSVGMAAHVDAKASIPPRRWSPPAIGSPMPSSSK
jgi:hypothetical protein